MSNFKVNMECKRCNFPFIAQSKKAVYHRHKYEMLGTLDEAFLVCPNCKYENAWEGGDIEIAPPEKR